MAGVWCHVTMISRVRDANRKSQVTRRQDGRKRKSSTRSEDSQFFRGFEAERMAFLVDGQMKNVSEF